MATTLGLFLALPTIASAQPVPDCYPNCEPTGSVSDVSPQAGQTITVTGGNFCPNSDVAVLFDGEEIGTGTADGDGTVSVQVTIPEDATPGDHVITLSGLGSDCETPANVEIPITVVSGAGAGVGGGGAGAGAGGGVAFTGANISLGMLLLAGLVIVGAASLIVGRRRKVGAGINK
jgi:hypothetical protein